MGWTRHVAHMRKMRNYHFGKLNIDDAILNGFTESVCAYED
jgi:hypothetical protein